MGSPNKRAFENPTILKSFAARVPDEMYFPEQLEAARQQLAKRD
jgi:hypothetical protein